MTVHSLSNLVRLYVRERARLGEIARVTAPNIRRNLERFADYAAVPAFALRPEHVERWLSSMAIARSTARQRFSQIRGFCRWLVRKGYLERDPTAQMRAPRQPRAVPRGCLAEQVAVVVASLPDDRGRLIVLLEVQEGLRACEVARLEIGDIDFTDRLVLVHGKGGKERILPLSGETWEALTGYLTAHPAGAGPLIRSYNDPSAGLCAAYVVHLVGRWLRGAGISGGGHRLRHTMATQLLREANADIRDVQIALGHSSLSSTSIYLPFSDARRLREVMGHHRYVS